MTEHAHLYAAHQDMVADLQMAGRPLADLTAEIQSLYLEDKRPWIIGFSGGKDSTCVLSLIYHALIGIEPSRRHKHVYVVSSDTLVETPVVVDMINGAIQTINAAAPTHNLPISAHSVTPKTDQTFWVNLLGRGYPAPTTRFRWCTERMKIDPVSEFIVDKVAKFGEVVVALGSRKQESTTRAQVIAKHRIDGSSLGRHTSLPNAYTYMPIEDWSADEVWEYLLSAPCPWGGNNRLLFELYKGSNQGECPLVIDKTTPSCGNSRFGCWTCTVVTEDKAIHGLIESGAKWMQPLLDFRNMLWDTTQTERAKEVRNYKRRTGRVSYAKAKDINDDAAQEAKLIPGPYWLRYRKEWLADLLRIEKNLRMAGHNIELVGRSELQAIRQHWLRDPNEPDWQDSLPAIYAAVYPEEDIEWVENDAGAFTEPDAQLLKELEEKFGAPAEMIMKLIEIEVSMSGLSRRKGLLNKLQTVIDKDWDSLEDIKDRHLNAIQSNPYQAKLEELRKKYEALPS